MEESDYLDLDGRQLRILLAIHEAGSLSQAARMLDMNQSTVSYWLDLLRKRLDDPLFVRSGNGVKPTPRAADLLPKAQEALRHLKSICELETYDPAVDADTLRLAGNAVERDFLQMQLLNLGLKIAPQMNFDFSPLRSTFQVLQSLRDDPLDFAVMPQGDDQPEGIMQRRIGEFTDVVFFDVDHPLPADDIDAFCERPQARISLGPDTRFRLDERLAKLGKQRRVVLQVGDFDSVLRLIRGTNIIATLPDCVAIGKAEGLDYIPAPWKENSKTLMLYWHVRNQSSARHSFWRERIVEIGQQVMEKD